MTFLATTTSSRRTDDFGTYGFGRDQGWAGILEPQTVWALQRYNNLTVQLIATPRQKKHNGLNDTSDTLSRTMLVADGEEVVEQSGELVQHVKSKMRCELFSACALLSVQCCCPSCAHRVDAICGHTRADMSTFSVQILQTR